MSSPHGVPDLCHRCRARVQMALVHCEIGVVRSPGCLNRNVGLKSHVEGIKSRCKIVCLFVGKVHDKSRNERKFLFYLDTKLSGKIASDAGGCNETIDLSARLVLNRQILVIYHIIGAIDGAGRVNMTEDEYSKKE